MSVFNSVPNPTLGTTGIVLPAEADILAGVQADINSAFGGGVNPALDTPQGQLASSLTAIIGDKNDLFAAVVNGIDPQYATGRMQDAIGLLYFLDRYAAVPTAVVCTVTGLAGTVIPVNAQAATQDGTLYLCTGSVTIPAGGSISANFAAAISGPVACPANTLNRVYIAIPGWDRINNPTDGVIGSDVETAIDFEYRRAQSVAVNANGSLPSIYGKLFNVANVIDVYCTENVTGSPLVIGSVTLAPHSLWACVTGGASADIAEAIWNKKSLGCNYNGDNATIVYDTSGYNIPYPQYTVNWKTSVATPVLFAVQIANSTNLPAGIVTLVKNAIIAAFSGLDGGTVARIGSTIYASRYWTPVLAVATPGTLVQILSLTLGIDTATHASVTMGIDAKPTISASDITVTLV